MDPPAQPLELVLQAGLLSERDFYGATDASLVDDIERAARKAPMAVRQRILALVARLRARELPKRVCVFPAYANREMQRELVARFYKGGPGSQRSAVEERIADLVRFATGRSVEIALCCPAAHMQLKEAATHVRWPGLEGVRPLTELRERVPRLSDLERSYSDLWKFYVFADARAFGELPSGDRFLFAARAVEKHPPTSVLPRHLVSVMLACAAADAGRVVYGDGIDRAAAMAPIGTICRLCPRADCGHRQEPRLIG